MERLESLRAITAQTRLAEELSRISEYPRALRDELQEQLRLAQLAFDPLREQLETMRLALAPNTLERLAARVQEDHVSIRKALDIFADQERIARAVVGSVEENERAARAVLGSIEEHERAARLAIGGFAEQAHALHAIGSANGSLAAMIERESAALLKHDRLAKDLSSVLRIAELSLAAQDRIAAVPFDSIGQLMGFDTAASEAAAMRFSTLAESYQGLTSRLRLGRELPGILQELPSRELFASATTLVAISPAEAKEELLDDTELQSLATAVETSLEDLLRREGPEFLQMYRGAREALLSSNPDRVRQALTSLRELVSHLLRKLAPDDEVRSWTSDPTHYHEGKPTRSARCQYVARNLGDAAPDFARFLEADAAEARAVIKQLNDGTHSLVSMPPNVAIVVAVRAEGLLKTLIVTARASDEN